MSPIVLRPRFTPVVVVAVLMGLLGAAALRSIIGQGRIPFLPAAVGLSLLFVGRGWFLHLRRRGLRLEDRGITALGTGETLAWPEVARVRLATELRPTPQGRHALLRFASLEMASGNQRVRFADLLGQGRNLAPDIEDVPDAPLALAIVLERRGVLDELAEGEEGEDMRPLADAPAAGWVRSEAGRAWGFVPFLLKLGPKLLGFLAGGLKLVKPGAAILTLGVYAVFFSWQFALGLMSMIFWHEYGHIRAMQRIGHPVRGIYFVPFLGGLAVHNAPIGDRWHRVYVDLNGPAYGLYLTLVPFGLSFVASDRWPWLSSVAAWWALINLFNLLPILPLDGGRTLSAIAFSVGSRIGATLVFLGLVVGALVAMLADQGLLALITLVGAAELVGELRAGTRRRLVEGLPADKLRFPLWWRLVRATRPPLPGAATPERIVQERTAFSHLMTLATGRSMSRSQLGLAILAYLGLFSALAVIFAMATRQAGAHGLLELLR